MSRPALGDSPTTRLQLKIAEAELEAIKDYQFQTRVPSMSEAVRQLVRIGLASLRSQP